MKAKKKPIVVEVWQLNSRQELPVWVYDAWVKNLIGFERKPIDGVWWIKTLEGMMVAGDGDYLIQGVRGELYPCERTIFEETYTIVEE